MASIANISFDGGLPVSIDAEKSILGAILLDNDAFEQCLGRMEPYMFSLDSHKRLYKCIATLMAKGISADIVTMVQYLIDHKELEAVGGAAYLSGLTDGLPRRISIEAYIEIVIEKWRLRQAIEICSVAVTRAADQSEKSVEILSQVSSQLVDVVMNAGVEKEPSADEQSELAWEALERKMSGDSEVPIPTGIASLSHYIGGYKKRKLYSIGGRPSLGKSSLLRGAIIQCMMRHIPATLFSMEMTSEDILTAIWAVLSGVPYEKITNGWLNLSEKTAVLRAKDTTKEWPLYIEDRPMRSADHIVARSRVYVRRKNVGFIGVDYLQKMAFPGKPSERHIHVGDAMVKFGSLAKDENVPVVLISSITESGDKNPNREPVLADFRASGDIAYDTDVAIIVHRERLEDNTIDPMTKLIVAKQRGGKLGKANALFNSNTILFEDCQQ
jgi:replicative DNA helicase